MPNKLEGVGGVAPKAVLDVNTGPWMNRVLIGHPMTGLVRAEWMMGRFGQTIPCNWSHMDVMQFLSPFVPLRYQVADAENLIAKAVVEKDFEWCFKADTLITTAEGAKRIRDVVVGEQVLTHMGRFRPVTSVMRRPVKQGHEIYWIRTLNSTTKATAGHPYLIRRGSVFLFVRADELEVGDRLCYPIQRGSVRHVDFNVRYNSVASGYHNLLGGKRNAVRLDSIPISVSLARLLGLYLAEGHATRTGLAFTLNTKEQALIEEIQQTTFSVFERKCSTASCRPSTIQLSLNIKNLSALFKSWYGDRARNKRVPKFVFEWPLRFRLAFLRAYLDGDGHDREGLVFYSTASEHLLQDIERLARECGLLPTSVHRSQQPTRRLKNGNPIRGGQDIFHGGLTRKSVGIMNDLLSSCEEDGDYIYVPVQSIQKHKWASSLKDNSVYNLEVAQDHSYVADSASVHNCLSWEQDNIPPTNALVMLNEYMIKGDVPVVGGLYFTKSDPAEPLVYRGIGNGYFANWRLGDKVWVSGVPFGFTLIHGSIIKAMWAESPEYVVNGQVTRRVFETPSESWTDPEKGVFMSNAGTSDLAWCKRVVEGNYFAKAGWPKYQKKEFPFLIDTSILVRHINDDGDVFPKVTDLQRWVRPVKKIKQLA